ncbi:fimbrial biogenesis chaperone [Paraburkholderia acidisoli]|uniref:Fimbria/pilus periplasmic chaperone n=1 Tax=Paraburkholderia acidisoli TaxID=2571748 RepID=A0A7Z2GQ93_9BURK|nr:molecular chaperone [Paraburkholderia acidisoli]QGZ65998.1 fimbria/pilus periplasmic chaperone [Paraburkholderia acidisoli]
MTVLRHWWRTACCALAAASCIGAAHAATLQISPVMVVLPKGANASGLTLRNSGDKPIYGQVRVFRWSQANGEDSLTPTQDVVASPPMIEIGAGGEQLVRLVRTAAAATGSEQSYRILIDELPEPDTTPANGVSIRLRYSVPVFIDPASEPTGEPNLSWRVRHTEAGWTLEVENTGRRRAQIAGVEIVNGAGNAYAINKGLLGYALAGCGRQWQLPLPAAADLNGPLKVRAAVNSVQTEASVVAR